MTFVIAPEESDLNSELVEIKPNTILVEIRQEKAVIVSMFRNVRFHVLDNKVVTKTSYIKFHITNIINLHQMLILYEEFCYQENFGFF